MHQQIYSVRLLDAYASTNNRCPATTTKAMMLPDHMITVPFNVCTTKGVPIACVMAAQRMAGVLRERADLLVEPRRPLVGHKLVLKAIVLRHERQEALHLGRHVVLDEPKLHTVPAAHQSIEIGSCELQCSRLRMLVNFKE